MQLFTALARTALRRIGEFKPVELATIAWASAAAGQSDTRWFSIFARVAEGVDDLNTQGLANAAWVRATAAQVFGKDLNFHPITDLSQDKKSLPRERIPSTSCK